MERFMDLINQLVLEHKMDMSCYDIDHFHIAAQQTLHEGVADLVVPDITRYCDYIDKVIDYANRVTMTPEQLVEFYSKIYKSPLIDEKNITIPVQTVEEIDKIRPEYLTNVPMEMDRVIQGILKGTVKESEIRVKYVTGDYFNKLRKQLVKTTLPYSDMKDLMVNNSTSVVHVTSVYIQSSVIPFLMSYRQNVKDLTIIAQNTKGRINNTYAEIMTSMRAVEDMESSGKLDVKQRRLLSYFRYNMCRNYMNLCAYLTTLIIRKMKYYVFNIMSYINLYNTIYNYFPEGEYVLHEYVEGDDLKSLDDSTLLNSTLNNGLNVAIPYIKNAINRKRIEISNLMAKRHNMRLNYHDMDNDNVYQYDEQPYAAMNRAVMNIANDLHTFEVNSQDPNMIVDDVLGKSHLDEPFTSQYTDSLSRFDSMDFYVNQQGLLADGDKNITMALYSELNLFERNIAAIANNISKVYHYIEQLQKKFETNLYNLDDNSYNEYKSTVENIVKNYKEFALQVTKKILSRLDSLSAMTCGDGPGEDPSDPTPDLPAEPESDYVTSSYAEAYDDICRAEKVVFEALIKDYYAMRKKKETGVTVVFEEDQNGDSGNNGNNSTTPSVQTDAQTQHSQNNTNNTTNNTQETKQSIIEKFKKWIQELINKFRDKNGRMVNRNNKWLAGVKADILALDTSNTTISLAKYENVNGETLTQWASSAQTKINGINANSIPNDIKSKPAAERYLFNGIPAKIGNETNFVARTKQFLTFGNTDKNDLGKYSGDDAKTKIENIIQFCEGYGNTYKNVSDAINKLSDAAAKKQQEIINALGTQSQTTTTTKTNNTGGSNNQNNSAQPATESTIMEADNQTQNVQTGNASTGNDKASKEKLGASSMLTTVVREYSGAVLTILEKKYLDYIKVLAKLAPQKGKEEPAKNEDNNTENQEGNQG